MAVEKPGVLVDLRAEADGQPERHECRLAGPGGQLDERAQHVGPCRREASNESEARSSGPPAPTGLGLALGRWEEHEHPATLRMPHVAASTGSGQSSGSYAGAITRRS